ncbi:hypothetical protein Scep_017958 [Stephania cephalantha]|uniref:Uncharacterized protein n=1 Tax=Stephania cephalantha TaxID=152367 RepID=A0AAP0IRF4_9MAGN
MQSIEIRHRFPSERLKMDIQVSGMQEQEIKGMSATQFYTIIIGLTTLNVWFMAASLALSLKGVARAIPTLGVVGFMLTPILMILFHFRRSNNVCKSLFPWGLTIAVCLAFISVILTTLKIFSAI